jgi:hypothetical protein
MNIQRNELTYYLVIWMWGWTVKGTRNGPHITEGRIHIPLPNKLGQRILHYLRRRRVN